MQLAPNISEPTQSDRSTNDYLTRRRSDPKRSSWLWLQGPMWSRRSAYSADYAPVHIGGLETGPPTGGLPAGCRSGSPTWLAEPPAGRIAERVRSRRPALIKYPTLAESWVTKINNTLMPHASREPCPSRGGPVGTVGSLGVGGSWGG